MFSFTVLDFHGRLMTGNETFFKKLKTALLLHESLFAVEFMVQNSVEQFCKYNTDNFK